MQNPDLYWQSEQSIAPPHVFLRYFTGRKGARDDRPFRKLSHFVKFVFGEGGNFLLCRMDSELHVGQNKIEIIITTDIDMYALRACLQSLAESHLHYCVKA